MMTREKLIERRYHVVVLSHAVRSKAAATALRMDVSGTTSWGGRLTLVFDNLLPDAGHCRWVRSDVDADGVVQEFGKGEGACGAVTIAYQPLVGDDLALDLSGGANSTLGRAIEAGPELKVLNPVVHFGGKVSVAPLIPYADGGTLGMTRQAVFYLIQVVVVPRDGMYWMSKDNDCSRRYIPA